MRAVYARGGLIGYAAVLNSPFRYVPHDAVVPGALTAGDLNDVAAALAPRPLRLAGLVDGLNRPASAEEAARTYAAAGDRLVLDAGGRDDAAASWLLKQLPQP